ncbi:MAG: CoA transferase subunit A [Egibacteraceae bacterium]
MTVDFIDARRQLERRDRSLRDKTTDATTALRLVEDGDHIAIGGCLYSRTPMALLFELLRQGQRDLQLSRCLTCYEGELFLATGACRHVVTSWMGFGAPWGMSRILRQMVESGETVFDEWSHLGIGMRYRAAAMGVPFLPMLSMLGSDLMEHTDARQMDCPFTGQRLCLVPALFPDVALIHVHRADPYGNAQIDGYRHMDTDVVRAARTVIVSAEEIVDPERMRREPDRTVIPHFAVDALVEAPMGAYPHECYGLYDADFDHFDAYAKRVRDDGLEGVRAYVAEHVTALDSFDDFLDHFPLTVALRHRRIGRELVR